jgi:hypothetical protein
MLVSCIFYPVDGGSKFVRSTGTHLKIECHIAESLTLSPEGHKSPLNLRVKIFRREI